MNKEEFMHYISENFDISIEAHRLINNILNYIAFQCVDEDEQYEMACALLDGTIGLTDAEIRKICL